MTARLNPSNKASSNVPFSPKPPESTSSQAPTAEKASTHPDTATPSTSPSQSKETTHSSSSPSRNQFTKTPDSTEKRSNTPEATQRSTAAALRDAYEANKILLAPGQVLTAKGLEVMMNQATHKRGEVVKFEVSAEASVTKGSVIKRSLEVFAGLGLAFSKEDSGHVQIQFSAEAAAKAGVGFGDLLKISGGVGLGGKITLRFNSAKDAAAWIANAVGHLPIPLFKVANVSLPYEPPTRITEDGASAFGEGKAKLHKSVSAEGKISVEQSSQTFVMPDGQKMSGARTTTKNHIKGEVEIGKRKLEFQRESTEYTQVGDPLFTNNGTYKQVKYSVKMPVALLKGPKDQVMAALAGVVKQAGFPSLSAQGMQQLYERFSNVAKKLGDAAHVGLSLEWNSVKENGEFRPLNRRVFLNVGLEKEGKSKIDVKGGSFEATVKASASAAKLLHEKVYGRSEAYLSQVYTGAISKQEWATFEEHNKPALQTVVKHHRKTYPNGAVETAYKETLQRTKDPNKANQAALEALKKIWTDTYKAKPEIEKDARTIFNQISNGKSFLGETVWKSFPLPKADQEAIEKLILKYKDKPELMAQLKTQLTHLLGEGSLKNLQLALQHHTGTWVYPSLSDGQVFRALVPNATFEGHKDGQAKMAADGILALASKIKSGTLSEDEKGQIERAITNAAKVGYLPALKALLVQSFGDGDKNLTMLQKALQTQNGTDSDAYRLLA